MNDKNDNADFTDAEVSDAYRAISAEKVPRALNETVLQIAADAVKRSKWRGWNFTFMNPVGFAAVLLISLALLVHINTRDTLPGADSLTDVGAENRPLNGRKAVQAGGIPGPTASSPLSAAGNVSGEYRRVQADDTLDPQSGPADDSGDSTVISNSSAKNYVGLCKQESIQTATSWQACIDELRTSGRVAEAEEETARMREIFPISSGNGESVSHQ
jgi:hypothetical protein